MPKAKKKTGAAAVPARRAARAAKRPERFRQPQDDSEEDTTPPQLDSGPGDQQDQLQQQINELRALLEERTAQVPQPQVQQVQTFAVQPGTDDSEHKPAQDALSEPAHGEQQLARGHTKRDMLQV